jgi:hypothetical protein
MLMKVSTLVSVATTEMQMASQGRSRPPRK